MRGDRIDTRTPPCQVLAGGKLCQRTDDRPIVMHVLLGPICRDHGLVPFTLKPRVPEVSHAPA